MGRLPEAARDAVLHGYGEQVRVSYEPVRPGPVLLDRFEGVIPWIERRYTETESDSGREKFEGYMRAAPCPACGGARLRPDPGRHRGGRSIAECARCRSARRRTAGRMALSDRDEQIGARVLKEVTRGWDS